MEYCYNIDNPSDEEINETKLKKFVTNIYKNKKFDDAFTDEDELPYLTLYSKTNNTVCIKLTSRSKKNIAKIESIHEQLKKTDLKFTKSISLAKPHIYDIKTQDWFSENCDINITGKRWNTLSHNGPYFAHLEDPYKPLGAKIKYDKKSYDLSPNEEKVLGFYAKRIISELKGNVTISLTKDEVFNKNYFTDLKTYLSPEHKKIFIDFSKFNFDDLIRKIEENKEKEDTKENKKKKKVIAEERKHKYGIATLDGALEKVGNFAVEPASLFMGRGKNPLRGRVKAEIFPEDVTINIGKNDKVPIPPKGHKFGEVIHDQNGIWLAKYKDSLTQSIKYIMFSAEGKFKGECDIIKYEKARKLEHNFKKIEEEYTTDLTSDTSTKRQLGTVIYLIANFGIRVGNEKDEDEADTVGASTLKVDNITLNKNNIIVLDFLGKDSIRFFKELKVSEQVYKNMKSFIKDKKGSDLVFDINSADINNYLKQIDKSFSAKVFRTRLASVIMYKALKKLKIPEGSSTIAIKTLFNKANAEVADVLNHTRNVSKKVEEGIIKLKEELKSAEKSKSKSPGKSIDKKIDSLKNRITGKTDVMKVAITTSLNNYIDPRIVVSWAKREKVPIETIYSAVLLKKFNWAITSINTSTKIWDYYKTPLIGVKELEPLDVSELRSKSKSKSTSKSSPAKSASKKKVAFEDEKEEEDEESTSEEEKSVRKQPQKRSKRGKDADNDKKVASSPIKLPSKVEENIKLYRRKNLFDDPPMTLKDKLTLKEKYKTLLEYCKNPTVLNLNKIPYIILNWIYPFAKYYNKNNIKKNVNSALVEKIEKFNNFSDLTKQLEIMKHVNLTEVNKEAKVEEEEKKSYVSPSASKKVVSPSKGNGIKSADINAFYYKNSILVTGEDTKKYKDVLQEEGGRWNGILKGWVFSRKKEDDIMELLGKDLDVMSEASGVKKNKPEANSAIEIIDYSDKSILVKGTDTKKFKEELKGLNGRWNASLGGWIFSKKKKPEVMKLFNKVDEEENESDEEVADIENQLNNISITENKEDVSNTIDFFTYEAKANKAFEKTGTPVNIEKKYKAFSNYFPATFTYNGKEYKSVENAYHSLKFTDKWYQEVIRNSRTPNNSKELGNQKSGQWTEQAIKDLIKESKTKGIKMRSDWDNVKDDIMYDLVKAKFEQNKELKDLLISTGDNIIREASPYDSYWGIGKDGLGENKLGKILMKIRDEKEDIKNLIDGDTSLEDAVRKVLKKKIKKEIKSLLTTLREDNELKPYTDEEVKKYISSNKKNIKQIINEMVKFAIEEDMLKKYLNPDNGLIRDVLYENNIFKKLFIEKDEESSSSSSSSSSSEDE